MNKQLSEREEQEKKLNEILDFANEILDFANEAIKLIPKDFTVDFRLRKVETKEELVINIFKENPRFFGGICFSIEELSSAVNWKHIICERIFKFLNKYKPLFADWRKEQENKLKTECFGNISLTPWSYTINIENGESLDER